MIHHLVFICKVTWRDFFMGKKCHMRQEIQSVCVHIYIYIYLGAGLVAITTNGAKHMKSTVTVSAHRNIAQNNCMYGTFRTWSRVRVQNFEHVWSKFHVLGNSTSGNYAHKWVKWKVQLLIYSSWQTTVSVKHYKDSRWLILLTELHVKVHTNGRTMLTQQQQLLCLIIRTEN
jgi:hypothetical protein